MQMNRQRKHNTLGRYGDLGGDADAVSSEDANGLLHIPFRGLVRILQAKHSESASDLENHLAVHRQNHAVAVGREFRGACSSTEALAFELADPTLHVRSTTVSFFVKLLVGNRRQLSAKAGMISVLRVNDVRLNQAEITLGSPVQILLASYDSALFSPTLRLIIKLPNQTQGMTGFGEALNRLRLGVLDRHGLGLLVRGQAGNVLDAVGITRLDEELRVESGVTAKNDEVIGKSFLKALNQAFELMLQYLASIFCAPGAKYCNRVSVQIAEHRRQTRHTVMAVV